MLMFQKKQAGFTIVELLIVIVVIAILATISVVAYNGVQERARAAKAHSDLKTLEEAIMVGRINQGKTLMGITGSGCTSCVGTQAAYDAALDKISAAAGVSLASLKAGDPWGNRYYIDENELETGSCVNEDYIGINPWRSGVTGLAIPFYQCK